MLILANAIIFIVIVILREDPLSTGILDVFFRKIRSCVSFTKREFMYSKFAPTNTASTRLFEMGCSSIPEEGNELSLRQALHKT
jgi:hypothetical protein